MCITYIYLFIVLLLYLVHDRSEEVRGEITYHAMQHMFGCKVLEI